jgi:hypothetical protein
MMLSLCDDSEAWLEDLLTHHHEVALARVEALLSEAERTPDGCLVTDTQTPRRVRFRGRQVAAYRFVYCVLTMTPAAMDEVVRHRCHNRRCINPEHLTLGSKADNKRDDWDYWANGVDPWIL